MNRSLTMLALVAALLTFSLTGCNSDSADTDTPTATETPTGTDMDVDEGAPVGETPTVTEE